MTVYLALILLVSAVVLLVSDKRINPFASMAESERITSETMKVIDPCWRCFSCLSVVTDLIDRWLSCSLFWQLLLIELIVLVELMELVVVLHCCTSLWYLRWGSGACSLCEDSCLPTRWCPRDHDERATHENRTWRDRLMHNTKLKMTTRKREEWNDRREVRSIQSYCHLNFPSKEDDAWK